MTIIFARLLIVEFKLDESADIALQQIQEKDYDGKYQSVEKQVVGLGINFSSATKSVNGWKTKNY